MKCHKRWCYAAPPGSKFPQEFQKSPPSQDGTTDSGASLPAYYLYQTVLLPGMLVDIEVVPVNHSSRAHLGALFENERFA